MRLETNNDSKPTPIVLSTEDLETIMYDPWEGSILSGICRALAEWGTLRFVVSGFGEDKWDVDVRTDLSTIVEQLQEVTDWLLPRSLGSSCQLDFFEQGVERFLTLSHVDNQMVEIVCKCPLQWQPSPTIEYVDRDHFRTMLGKLAADFIEFAYSVAPTVLTEHPLFVGWIACISRLQASLTDDN